MRQLALVVLLIVCSVLCARAREFNINCNSNLVMYWGQNSHGATSPGENQLPLDEYCDKEAGDMLVLSFLSEFNADGLHPPILNLANSCLTTFDNSTLLHCPNIGKAIEKCQKRGKAVILSLGGASGAYGFTSEVQAERYADKIWDMFLGGTAQYRPFNGAVLDGIDLDIEGGSSIGYVRFVQRLRERFIESPGRRFYVTAAPQCPYPDFYSGPILDNAYLDMVFVQFYNNYCGVDKPNWFNFEQWHEWATTVSANKDVRVYLGVPGSPLAASTGYMPLDRLEGLSTRPGKSSTRLVHYKQSYPDLYDHKLAKIGDKMVALIGGKNMVTDVARNAAGKITDISQQSDQRCSRKETTLEESAEDSTETTPEDNNETTTMETTKLLFATITKTRKVHIVTQHVTKRVRKPPGNGALNLLTDCSTTTTNKTFPLSLQHSSYPSRAARGLTSLALVLGLLATVTSLASASFWPRKHNYPRQEEEKKRKDNDDESNSESEDENDEYIYNKYGEKQKKTATPTVTDMELIKKSSGVNLIDDHNRREDPAMLMFAASSAPQGILPTAPASECSAHAGALSKRDVSDITGASVSMAHIGKKPWRSQVEDFYTIYALYSAFSGISNDMTRQQFERYDVSGGPPAACSVYICPLRGEDDDFKHYLSKDGQVEEDILRWRVALPLPLNATMLHTSRGLFYADDRVSAEVKSMYMQRVAFYNDNIRLNTNKKQSGPEFQRLEDLAAGHSSNATDATNREFTDGPNYDSIRRNLISPSVMMHILHKSQYPSRVPRRASS
ncbi:glycoside hydrolase superfamily [Kickxella alabastrina]|uniref:glycoside hydrolase superfamily n=1 Tax=Kickxella alabastrina TaxID=61397 RepID=UPI0022208FDC|nr:glycoside hydrolase superfamily [Kickxella alabastrina]KAI7831923.1 glycoside hydrolase superfamily [Kickxella alabastrina]